MKKILLLNFALVLTLLVNAQTVIPVKLNGNWFRSDNAEWGISLLDSSAIYKSQVWKYLKFTEKDGVGTLRMKNRSKNLTLYIKAGDHGTFMIGETPSKLSKYMNEPDESVIPVDTEEFKLPIFKSDTAIYCGYYKNFSTSRYPQRTGMVYVNDVLAGQNVPYSFTISEDGYFEVKIPHSNPQIVMVTKPLRGTETVFIEPGKRIFQFIDNSKPSQPYLFMGQGARVNSDLDRLNELFNMKKKLQNFTKEQYKEYCETSLPQDLNKLKEFSQAHRICYKAEKLTNMVLHHRFAMLNYQLNYLSNKMSDTQSESPVISTDEIIKHSFLTTDFVNDPFAVMTSEYVFVINNMRKYVSQFNRDQSPEERNEKLTTLLGIQPGLAMDLLNSQDICKPMLSNKPVPDDKLQNQLKNIKTPFIADYVKFKNEDLKKKNELSRLATKTKAGQLVRAVPTTAGDKIFEAIMDNYKGKIVFVDFWATWCAPCLSGIQNMKPLKEEMTKENVVFVYITNFTSPQQSYDNMIPGIKGEHYRLTPDEFNIIADQFKISGIPHYMLVGKDGRIINEHLSYTGNEQLKNLLMKFIKE